MKVRDAALLVVTIVLLLIGSILSVFSLMHTVEWRYEVDIDAPSTVTWSVWIPAPAVDMDLRSSGDVISLGKVDTPYGMLENVTGSGQVVITYLLSKTLLKTTSFDEDFAECAIGLTGHEGLNVLRVWRTSSDPGSDILIYAVVTCSSTGLSGSLQCGGPGYSWDLHTGWNSIATSVGDCSALITDLYVLVSEVLIGTGIVVGVFCVILIVRDKRKGKARPTPAPTPPQLQ